MELIEHIEVTSGAGQSALVFSNLTSYDYTDLKLVCSLRNSTAANYYTLSFNGSTANFTQQQLDGDGSVASAVTRTDGIMRFAANSSGFTSNTFASAELIIPNYQSNNNKSFSVQAVTENNATQSYLGFLGCLWSQTAAIDSITLTSPANFVQYSSATLYGIRKYDTAGAPKATGGIISYDSVNNYWVHTFTASGTFTPTENLTNVEYLVIAGGGGSGQDQNGGLGWGGCGAGGYRSSVAGESSGANSSAETPLSLTASTGYTVTIGAGGAAGGGGSKGSNTTFHTITSTGGGHGAGYNLGAGGYQDPEVGGSGGGGSYNRTTGALGTTNQGLAGGNVLSGEGGGGGGGAGSAGSNSSGPGADGGDGIASSITGTSIYRAGGGGGGGDNATGAAGGQGGQGGGGRGGTSYTTDVGDGLPATGGGGGGAAAGTGGTGPLGGKGGSGVVIVRYAA